ncbi:hypothetical protein LOTGIDRAFT_153259 [Lottia gigantea]|uniref:Uncharacterized protein n=1 Tax=Lottia gigantea TaxID=225164 RepID=V4BXG6_LOTGI|nr:hypothetical protein LOTGIDRAFT_153259 [Lottia gigantea]ESO93789.1 hypothetical protein LOTGIDRAFT_153259 [Lottia gigantea]
MPSFNNNHILWIYRIIQGFCRMVMTPGFSPAELLFGRKLRTQVPVSPRELIPNWSHLSLVREREEIYRAKTKCNFDKRHKVNRLKDLEPEQNVFIRDSKSHGTIVKKHRSPRS